jgi:hypothetical protein
MSTFRLTFREDGLGAGKFVEYEGDNPSSVLTLLKGERCGRSVQVDCDGRHLATLLLCNRTGDFWIVSPPAGESS